MAKTTPDNNEGQRDLLFSNRVLIAIAIILALLIVFGGFGGNKSEESDQAKSDEDSKQQEDKKSEEKSDEKSDGKSDDQSTSEASSNAVTETTEAETDDAYSYTAGTGESLTGVARRAVAKVDSSLNPAQRVAAETRLVSQAGGDLLEVGQKLNLSKSDVDSAVKWAKGLSSAEQAAWKPYADLVAW